MSRSYTVWEREEEEGKKERRETEKDKQRDRSFHGNRSGQQCSEGRNAWLATNKLE
jgi:hypothetical protein